MDNTTDNTTINLQNQPVNPQNQPAQPDNQPIAPAPQAPPPLQVSAKKKISPLFWVIVAVVVAAAGAAWWYVSRMETEPVIQPVQIDEETREDTLTGKEINEVDLGDLDSEFEAIDNDLDSL